MVCTAREFCLSENTLMFVGESPTESGGRKPAGAATENGVSGCRSDRVALRSRRSNGRLNLTSKIRSVISSEFACCLLYSWPKNA